MIYIAFAMIFSGFFLDCFDILLPIQEDTWLTAFNVCKDMQILGAMLLAFIFCSYKKIRVKAVLYMLCVWRGIVLVVNQTDLPTAINPAIMAGIVLFLGLWLYRMRLPELKSVEPRDDEAYYILAQISTWKGLFQAVFMPWYPARYETRIIVDGNVAWSVHRGKFTRSPIYDNINDIGVKVPIGRRLHAPEVWKLNSLVGQKVRLGKDCRKLLVA